jgi:glycosyltransferase involved in cell wall biosynthesis
MRIQGAKEMRVAICWTEIHGYLTACWRELARVPGLELLIVAGKPGAVESTNGCSDEAWADLPCRLLGADELRDAGRVADLLAAFRPDVVVLNGWVIPAFVRLAFNPALASARFVLTMDTPREDTWRQRLARLKVGRYVDRMDRVVVPGERGWQFARHFLKVPEARLCRGLNAIAFDTFAPTYERRLARPEWPRGFVFVGRYVPDKGLDVLLAAYRIYREATPDSWPLTCCGRGPLAGLLRQTPGAADLGFVQPAALPDVLVGQGASVLASRYEPWGQVVVEHAAAGLPVVCSEACGAAVELVRPYYNGLLAPTGDAAALARALAWMHRQHAELPEMGRRSRELAAPYSARLWARRWLEMCRGLVEGRAA